MGTARSVRTGLVVLLAVLLTLALAAPAGAAGGPPGQITCVATPRVSLTQDTEDPSIFHWTIRGGGACVAAKGTLTVFIAGQGQGSGLGFCTGLFVQDLVIPMVIQVERVFSGQTFVRTAVWGAPVTTFPEATPFLVTNPDNASLVGAGVIFSHIFFGCDPDKPQSESSTVVWTQDFKGSGMLPE